MGAPDMAMFLFTEARLSWKDNLSLLNKATKETDALSMNNVQMIWTKR